MSRNIRDDDVTNDKCSSDNVTKDNVANDKC